MISVQKARDIITSKSTKWGVEEVAIEESVGRILRQDIFADRDLPPYDRVTMDGIALSYEAFKNGLREFVVYKVQMAGEPPVILENDFEAIEIMTGAVLSQGCDMVVRYEDLTWKEDGVNKNVTINLQDGMQWQNVHKRGSDERKNDILIKTNKKILPTEVAIFATSGYSKVSVSKLPRVAIISTGDELVEVNETPLAHQIRKSNSISIRASLNQLGVENKLFHLNDDKEELRKHIHQILNEFDVLLLSGGVSKGKADYLPEILDDLNVEKLFHHVAQRPGKPFWFGESGDKKYVFAFPGNPVSTFMCYRVYFLPWFNMNLGLPENRVFAKLEDNFQFKPELDYFLQVKTTWAAHGEITTMPESGGGSGDLANLTKSDAFLLLPANRSEFKKGEVYEYFPYSFANFF